ncbi:MAG: hypothetical protein SFX73_26330 [Kofleriaceae bacterium]|nr:hypothetical protein [Kofleriaceae bacterium]
MLDPQCNHGGIEQPADGPAFRNAACRVPRADCSTAPITLLSVTAWADRVPDATELATMHHVAHAGCLIASSVKTEIVIA